MAIEKAKQLSDFFEVFSPTPLREEDMELFYCDDTMRYRTGDEFVSPISDIKQIVTSKSTIKWHTLTK